MKSDNFKKALAVTKFAEGGYSNDPDDKGGETYKGISRKNWPNWQGWVLIDNEKKRNGELLSWLNAALEKNTYLQRLVDLFYRENFWDINKLDNLPFDLAMELFDTGVNMGTTVAAKFLQEALNLCNNKQRLYANVEVDGKIGPITLYAVSLSDTKRVHKTMNILQGEKYLNIMRSDETQEKFWGGWMERVIC